MPRLSFTVFCSFTHLRIANGDTNFQKNGSEKWSAFWGRQYKIINSLGPFSGPLFFKPWRHLVQFWRPC